MKKIIFTVSIILLFLCQAMAYSQESPPLLQERIKKNNDRAKTNANTKTNTKPPQNRMPIVVNKVHATKNETRDQHSDTNTTAGLKRGKLEKEALWGITDFFNLLLVVFTFVLAFCNIMLWITTRKAADAAKESADAAKKSVDIIPAIERAYIYVPSVNADFESWRHVKVSQLSPISIEIRNYGKTPAKLVKIITKIQVGESDGIKISWKTPDDEEIIDSVGRFVASDSKESFFYYMHSAIGDGDYHIIFSGEVRYKDIFEKDHTVYFSWSLVSRFQRGFYINDPEKNYTT